MLDQYLDMIDSIVEESWNLPFSGGKRMVDVEKLRDLVDSVRLNLPKELKEAKIIVSDRDDILKGANAEAEMIIKRAEQKAREMLSEQEIVKTAQERSKKILTETARKTKEMERAALELTQDVLKECEENLTSALKEIKSKRSAISQK